MAASKEHEQKLNVGGQRKNSFSTDLAGPLKQIVAAVQGSLLVPHPCGLDFEDSWLQLETTDENFHSYEFVRKLQGRVNAVVGPLVEAKMDEVDSQDAQVVAQITQEVLSSTEFSQLCQSVVSDVKQAVEEIMACETSQMTSPEEQVIHSSPGSSSTQYYSLDDSCASELSSVNQTGIMFMSSDQLQAILDGLKPNQPLEVRWESMQHLSHFPPGDLVTSESWLLLRAALKDALGDGDRRVAGLSLKLFHRMFRAHSSLTTREVYTCLCEHLHDLFGVGEGDMFTLSMGMDPADDRCLEMLSKFRLLNHLQILIPSYWVRYNERVLEEIVEHTITLLSLSYQTPNLLGPISFITLLDPKASWFRKWMHGQYSRTKVLQQLKLNQTLLQGVVFQLMDFTVKPSSKRNITVSGGDDDLGYYNEFYLKYLHFVHSLCLLETLLLYRGGRELFPVTMKGREDVTTVTVVDILSHLLHIVYDLNHIHHVTSSVAEGTQRTFDPILLIGNMLKKYASGNAQCRSMLCNDTMVQLLLSPLKQAIGQTQSPSVSDDTLIMIADVLAVLASTDSGREYILRGGAASTDTTSRPPPAVQSIAQFTVHALSRKSPLVSHEVATAWLFVCRQLYNTAEGLHVLLPYSIHMHIANCLNKLDSIADRIWSEALVDNLLNFAGTPKGLLLLQQSGQMAKCTQYMDHRYTQKFQVSRVEKFGYGYMATQVASTAAGVVELLNSGFVATLVRDLWNLVDGEENDYRLTAPRAHPLDPIDRAAHKAMLSLLNILSSFPALYEALNQPQLRKQDIPSTVFALLDRLVLVDSESKSAALFNYEEAHLFGLRLFSALVTSLDSFLYLDAHYGLTSTLLALQRKNQLDSGQVIVDANSVERNRILVSCHHTGGSNERQLPPHYLKDNETYTWAMFDVDTPPSHYQLKVPPAIKDQGGGDLSAMLSQPLPESKTSTVWLKSLKDVLLLEFTKHNTLNTNTVAVLLQKTVAVQNCSKEYVKFIPSVTTDAVQTVSNNPLSELGAKLAVRYGQYLGLLDLSDCHVSSLQQVTHHASFICTSQCHKRQHTNLGSLRGDYVGYDWFAATIFLVMRGSIDDTASFLQAFANLLSSGYLWIPRLHLSAHLPLDIAYSGMHPITFVSAHYVEWILQCEVPLVHSAFRLSGYTPSQICYHWLSQCFWNFLDWPEICNYIVMCITLGIDYQVYFCVAIMKHLEHGITLYTHEQNLLVFLKEEGIRGFGAVAWLPFMQKLASIYGHHVLKDMQSLGVCA